MLLRLQFGLLGDDPAALPLVRAMGADPHFTLAAAAMTGALAPAVLAAQPGARLYDRWEDLLEHAAAQPAPTGAERRQEEHRASVAPLTPWLIDPPKPERLAAIAAVLVAGSSDRILEGARRLASEGMPLLVVPCGGQGPTFFHELSLVRNDNRVFLAPVFPLRYLPEVSALRTAAGEGGLGRIVQWQLSRELPRAAAAPPLLTPGEITAALLADADLLRSLGGPYNRVTAVYAGLSDGRYSSATVTLTGDGLPDALWTLRSVAEPGALSEGPAPSMAVLGPGRWTLTAIGSTAQRELRSGQIDLAQDSFRPGWAHWLLTAFASALFNLWSGRPAPRDAPEWSDLIRAAEVVDGAQRSVTRRRTIDLYHETASERGQFKSQMTAIGCGVLILTLFLMTGLLVVGAAVNVPATAMRVARVLVFAPLFVFLALQLLVFIARPASGQDAKPERGP